MLKEPISPPVGYRVSPAAQQSFVGKPQFFSLRGPGRIMRLVQFKQVTRTGESLPASNPKGEFWFDERLFQRLRAGALADLATDNAGPGGSSNYTPRKDLVDLHVKFAARDALAVSSNWNKFDAYVTFTFGPNENLIVLGGKTLPQPYYSQGHPDHDVAQQAGVLLPGGEFQYVVDFTYPPNRRFLARISGPVRL